MRYLSLFLLLFLSSFVANAIEYRWLELLKSPWSNGLYTSHTERQIEWLDKQDNIKEQYIYSLNHVSVEDDIKKFWHPKRTIREKKTSDFTIKLELTTDSKYFLLTATNSLGEVTEIINSKNLGQLSSYEIYDGYILRNIYLSPSNKYLLVEAVKDRTTTVADYLIYKLSDLSMPPAHIKDTFHRGLVWDGEDAIIYGPKLNPEFYFKYDLNSGLQYYLSDFQRGFRNVLETTFQYKMDYIWTNGESQPTVTFKLKHYESDQFDTRDFSNYISDEKGIGFISPQKFNKTSIIFSNSSRNATSLVFVNYSKDENKKVKIGDVNLFEAPKKGSIQSYFNLGDHYLVVYLSGTEKLYFVFDSKGKLKHELTAPLGRLNKIKKVDEDRFEMYFSSEVVENLIVSFSLSEVNIWNSKKINKDLFTDKNGSEYIINFIESTSLDGTKIPSRVVYKKDVTLSSDTPLYILGYGGHGLVTYFIPRYEVGLHSFLNAGGIYATPALRGGGEFGNEWYTQVFNSLVRYEDAESAIKELHKRGYSSPQTTAFEGWSSGGLLAGVMMTRNPELFKLVIPGNGLHDMERHEILQGPFQWADDYGNSRSVEAIEYLRSYSPVYNAKKKREYPTIYTMVGDQDVRVNPSQSYKITAVLQDHQIGNNPIVLDRYPTAGHWIQHPASMNEIGVIALQRKWKVIFNELGIK